MSCRSQAEVQQFANTRSQPTTESTRPGPEVPRATGQLSKYKVDKIPLGSTIPFEWPTTKNINAGRVIDSRASRGARSNGQSELREDRTYRLLVFCTLKMVGSSI